MQQRRHIRSRTIRQLPILTRSQINNFHCLSDPIKQVRVRNAPSSLNPNDRNLPFHPKGLLKTTDQRLFQPRVKTPRRDGDKEQRTRLRLGRGRQFLLVSYPDHRHYRHALHRQQELQDQSDRRQGH